MVFTSRLHLHPQINPNSIGAAELLCQIFKHHFRTAIMLRPPWWSGEESDPAEVSRLGEGSRWSSRGLRVGPDNVNLLITSIEALF